MHAHSDYLACLARQFGSRADEVRDTPAAQGEPGSELNQAYLAYEAARTAWRSLLMSR